MTLKSLAFSPNGKMGTEVGRQEGEKERTGEGWGRRGGDGRGRAEMREVGKTIKAGRWALRGRGGRRAGRGAGGSRKAQRGWAGIAWA